MLKEDFEVVSFFNWFECLFLVVDFLMGGDFVGRLVVNFVLVCVMLFIVLNVEESEDKIVLFEKGEDGKVFDFWEKMEVFVIWLCEWLVCLKEDGDENVKIDGIYVIVCYWDGVKVMDVLKDSVEKGYDLFFVGVDFVSLESGGFFCCVFCFVFGFVSMVVIVVLCEGCMFVSDNELCIFILISDIECLICVVEFGCVFVSLLGVVVLVIYILELNEV